MASSSIDSPPTVATISQKPSPPVQREPSQQELEIAQHLIEHSQRAPPASPSSPQAASEHPENAAHHVGYANSSDAKSGQHTLNETPQEYTPPHAFTPIAHYGAPAPRTSPMSNTEPGGQSCSNCGTTKTPLWRRSPTGAVICNACGLYYKARNQMRPVGMKRGAGASHQQSNGQRDESGPSTTSIQGNATYVTADQGVGGTCPGGGRCNGTGGHEGCSGCPAYNNRVSKTAQIAPQRLSPTFDRAISTASTGPPAPTTNMVVACQNCGTTITPLWRRDESGRTICNACGLYHKLHGSHRPMQMKKAEIKRRKRIVAAGLSPSSYDTPNIDHLIDDDVSVQSGTRASVAPSIASSQDRPSTRPSADPIPVNFTYSFRQYPPDPADSQKPDEHTRLPHRKRSFSTSEHDEEPHEHALDGTSPSQAGGARSSIDPSLSIERDSVSASATSATKGTRREELQREAESMRQLLEAKERELAELGDEE